MQIICTHCSRGLIKLITVKNNAKRWRCLTNSVLYSRNQYQLFTVFKRKEKSLPFNVSHYTGFWISVLEFRDKTTRNLMMDWNIQSLYRKQCLLRYRKINRMWNKLTRYVHGMGKNAHDERLISYVNNQYVVRWCLLKP